jgi:uncharacterized protein (TIGR02246 family)
MSADAEQVRSLIERWAAAVRAGDLDAVVADHAEDIVMFDVPPPHEGVRGLEAYRATWPPFFAWLRAGAAFDLVALDVSAGPDVAFAHALLRCGTPAELAAQPDLRLRLTVGLRKEGARWLVVHEHHSFPVGADAAAQRELRAVHDDWFAGTARKDLDALMAHVDDDVVSYEHDPPLQHLGLAAVRAACARGLDAAPGAVGWDVPDLRTLVSGELAVAWGLNHMTAQLPGGVLAESWSRGTRVFRRRAGRWSMVHQHVSFPYDPATGAARTDLRP